MAIDLTILPKAQLARRIAEELGETDPEMLSRIRRIVLQHGNRYAVRLLLRTRKIEADGGWFTTKKKIFVSRQSPVEVFFNLHENYQHTGQSNSVRAAPFAS